MTITVKQLEMERDQSFAVRLRDFLFSSRDKTRFVCVFEGLDHFYYGPRIDSFLGPERKRHNLSMRGKKHVLRLYVERGGGTNQLDTNALYFIDRDFETKSESTPYLYRTPCYSIENFYVQEFTYRRILADVFGLSEAVENQTAEFRSVIEFITTAEQDFNTQLAMPLNAFVCAVRTKGSATGENSDPLNMEAFTNSRIFDFFKISHRGFQLVKVPTFENLVSAFECPPQLITLHDMKASADALSLAIVSEQSSLSRLGRGKFALGFAIKLFAYVWADSGKTKPKLFKQRRPALLNLDFGRKEAIALLSPFAESPTCLTNFLRAHL